eukprot:3789141-Rhodomonas_salina.3
MIHTDRRDPGLFRRRVQGTDMTSNDMRCFLKCALIDACHAMLEGSASKESRFLAKVLDNFETRNLYAQVPPPLFPRGARSF